jgi:hypothetical protein
MLHQKIINLRTWQPSKIWTFGEAQQPPKIITTLTIFGNYPLILRKKATSQIIRLKM